MNQTDRVLIALTKSGPRTAANIAVETRIPVASVRRVLSTLSVERKFRALRGVHALR